jgi:hypothetical protein
MGLGSGSGSIAGPRGPAGVGVPAGGTTDQALVKLSNDDHVTGWKTLHTHANKAALDAVSGTNTGDQDLTGLVPKSTLSAKGSLIGATAQGVPADIPVGSDSQVLTADSSVAAGVSWAAIPAAQIVALQVVAPTTDVAVGDGQAYFIVPSYLDGWNLVGVHAGVVTAGTTGSTDIDIYNLTDAADMLTAPASIASGAQAATAPTIDTDHDDVAADDILRVDVSAASTTAPKGLVVTLEFARP